MTSQWASQESSQCACCLNLFSESYICCPFLQLPLCPALTASAQESSFMILLELDWTICYRPENMVARFQKSKPSKWHALPCKCLLWSQLLPRGPGMVPLCFKPDVRIQGQAHLRKLEYFKQVLSENVIYGFLIRCLTHFLVVIALRQRKDITQRN